MQNVVTTGTMIPFYSPKIIPLAYDDSLSYMEQIYALVAKVNNLIEEINQIESDFTGQAKEYVDEAIKELQDWVVKENAEFKNRVDNAIYELNVTVTKELSVQKEDYTTRITELNDLLEAELLRMQNLLVNFNLRLAEISADINKNNNYLLTYFDTRMKILEDLIKQEVADRNGHTISVKNPTNGKITNLDTALEDLFAFNTYFAMDAETYDRLQLTAEEYDSRGITAQDFDTIGLFKFFDNIYLAEVYAELKQIRQEVNDTYEKTDNKIRAETTMHSPFTGVLEKVKNVVSKLASLHMETPTAEEYDNTELTAEEYDNKELTAYQYDWYGLDGTPNEVSLEHIRQIDMDISTIKENATTINERVDELEVETSSLGNSIDNIVDNIGNTNIEDKSITQAISDLQYGAKLAIKSTTINAVGVTALQNTLFGEKGFAQLNFDYSSIPANATILSTSITSLSTDSTTVVSSMITVSGIVKTNNQIQRIGVIHNQSQLTVRATLTVVYLEREE